VLVANLFVESHQVANLLVTGQLPLTRLLHETAILAAGPLSGACRSLWFYVGNGLTTPYGVPVLGIVRHSAPARASDQGSARRAG
jgi:hypothetical protein